MKHEFVTLYGKATIEREVLYLRVPYLPFEKTAFAQIGIEMVFISLLVSRFFSLDTTMRIMITLIWSLLILSRVPLMYDKFFKRNYSRRIPLSAITNITTEDDVHGLQTEVKLHLKNGRYKKITFRKLENQHQPFIETVSSICQSKSLVNL